MNQHEQDYIFLMIGRVLKDHAPQLLPDLESVKIELERVKEDALLNLISDVVGIDRGNILQH